MKIEVNIEKKYAFLIVGALLVLAGVFYVTAQFNQNAPNHPLQQVTNAAGTASVDANGNNVIDNAERLEGVPASGYCKTGGAGCPQLGDPWTDSGLVVAGSLTVDAGSPASADGFLVQDSNGNNVVATAAIVTSDDWQGHSGIVLDVQNTGWTRVLGDGSCSAVCNTNNPYDVYARIPSNPALGIQFYYISGSGGEKTLRFVALKNRA